MTKQEARERLMKSAHFPLLQGKVLVRDNVLIQLLEQRASRPQTLPAPLR